MVFEEGMQFLKKLSVVLQEKALQLPGTFHFKIGHESVSVAEQSDSRQSLIRAARALASARAHVALELLHIEVNHRSDVQRQQLGDHQSTDHRETQGLARIAAFPIAQRDGQS